MVCVGVLLDVINRKRLIQLLVRVIILGLMRIGVLDRVDSHGVALMLVAEEDVFVAFAVLATLIGVLNGLDLLFVSEVRDDFASDPQFLVMLHFGVHVHLLDIFLFLLQEQRVILVDGDFVEIQVEPFLLDLLVVDRIHVLAHRGLVRVANLDGLDLLFLGGLELVLLDALLAGRARLVQLRVDG